MGEPSDAAAKKQPDLSRYKTGKIYKIVVNGSDLVYYGSTCTALSKRMASHRTQYKLRLKDPVKYSNVTSFELFKIGEPKIVLVEDFACERKEQLERRERYYIENNNCVNKIVPGRTGAEYCQANSGKIAEYQREYRQRNVAKSAEYHREYHQGQAHQKTCLLYFHLILQRTLALLTFL